jgi:hypothetical protein
MEAGQMHRLGKRLVDLSAEAAGTPGDIPLTLGEAAVLEDAIEHPDSSIRLIHERTGFRRSHVSASVARLKERGLLAATAGDSPSAGLASGWRSNTRVRPTAATLKAISRRADEAVARAVADPSQAGRAIALMEELAAILL